MLHLEDVVDFTQIDRTPWTLWMIAKFESTPFHQADRETFPPNTGIYGNAYIKIAIGRVDTDAFVALQIQGIEENFRFMTMSIPTSKWFYLEARQTKTKVWLRVNDFELSMPAVMIDPAGRDSEVQIGSGFLVWDLAFFQACSTNVHCGDLETHRWELQEKYGFSLSPVAECSDDEVEEPTEAPRRARMVQMIG